VPNFSPVTTADRYNSLSTKPNKLPMFHMNSIFSIFLQLQLDWQSCIWWRSHVYM